MKNVEQSDIVEDLPIATLTDPSETQRLSTHKKSFNNAITTNTTQEVALPAEKGKGEKVAKKEKKALQKPSPAPSKHVLEEAQTLRIRCKQLCVSTFFKVTHPSVA